MKKFYLNNYYPLLALLSALSLILSWFAADWIEIGSGKSFLQHVRAELVWWWIQLRSFSLPDFVNGAFELGGGLAILNHCRAAQRSKKVAGVSIVSCAFFASWGAWNLFYYPSLAQWCSVVGGAVVFGANVWWVVLLLRYRKN